MRLQRLVSDESHATVGAFELDSFVELRDRNYVVTINNRIKYLDKFVLYLLIQGMRMALESI